ncbi:hypothetical protein JIN85_14755 [Luteolibacter pohnpeiensis]|uniref:Uncharacterized protein n=1 Tax=Luteolibacter pohnpeiensis TaxID=454153 RepID=A0A934S5X1_9BACT|nr:hypothetical protein [Luteolibacter pohnpeiensis]MBK1883675.1 hypothetical protein [Luteolibacter pohnpeiensis]
MSENSTVAEIDPAQAIEAYRAKRKAANGDKRTNQKVLSPGTFNRELQTALAEIYSTEEISAYIDSLLVATFKGQPDNRTRLAALTLLMAYLVGKPVERQEVVSVNVDADSLVGIEERLRTSPTLCRALGDALERVKNEQAVEVGSNNG